MKKIILCYLFLTWIIPTMVFAGEKTNVTLSKCIDGDTASFMLKGKEIKARFLAIDTPETKHPQKKEEPFGRQASKFTCDQLKNATTITLEYDDDSDKTDKYDRHLVWVFVDQHLLQDLLIEKGYAKVDYLYGDYQYTNQLQKTQTIAKENRIGIWGDYVDSKDNTIYYIVGGGILLFILVILIPNLKNKSIKRIAKKKSSTIKRNVVKNIKKILK